MDKICYHAIGVVHSPFKEPGGAPTQPRRARGTRGQVEIYPEFVEGLSDLDGFSHIIMLCHFHRSEGFRLKVTPHWDPLPRGLFATRAPRRPNPIGLSIVRLERIEGNILHIIDLDMLEGTPVLDIKPYVREFDDKEKIRVGWLEGKSIPEDGSHTEDADHR